MSQEPKTQRVARRLPVEGPQAVMQTPKQLRVQMERDSQIRAIINEYIAQNMVEGKDYGSIEIKGHTSKPSLFKPGAEKFCGLFQIRPTFKKDPETIDMLGNTPGIIAYKCELVDSRGRIIGEGRGTAKTDPVNGSDFDINKQVKIAQKRAQIDAVLRTGGLSDFFTQDMEDKSEKSVKAMRFATDKQIDWIRQEAAKVSGSDNAEDIDAWVKQYLSLKPANIPLYKVGDAVDKIRQIGSEMQTEMIADAANEPIDTVVDLTDEDIEKGLNEGSIPY